MRATTLLTVNQRTISNGGHHAAPDSEEEDWASFLQKHLRELGWDNLDLSKACGIDRSQVSRWLRREAIPGPASVRLVCAVLEVDIRYGIVATGSYTAEELRLHTHPSTREVIRTCKPEMLADELLRRARGATTESVAPGRGTFEEQRGPVIAPLVFQDGRQNGQTAG